MSGRKALAFYTVRELIAALEGMPPDAYVVVEQFGSDRSRDNSRVVDPLAALALGTHHADRVEWHWSPRLEGNGVLCVCLSPYFTE